jgi:hypothetical protein
MRWFFVGVLGLAALVAWSEPAAAHAKAGARLPKKRVRHSTVVRHKTAPAPAGALSKAPDSEPEPIPAGEQAVYWAQPSHSHAGVKIHLTPSLGATALGEIRGDTAVAVKLDAERAGGGCRSWLEVLPEGYLCQDEVQLRPGYLSDPPAQEKATAWQRLRYGVIKAASAALERAAGEPVGQGGYLRSLLHRGDGITVIRELADRVQIYGKQWLRKMDVALVTPPALTPVNLQAVPPAQRFLLAWAVPPAGESQVALYPPGGSQPVFIPRYSKLWWTDTKASPGRVLVYLTEETRAGLEAHPETRAAAQAAAMEIDPTQLRRVTPTPFPDSLQPDERWIDISLTEQVAVAYLGETPLLATLISTGKGTTPAGSFFIYRKYLSQTMANVRGAPSQYDFREVPYAQFFNGRIGLHAVLWHDLLGHPVSHGCVNMSPVAAEQFFSFTKPEMPAGWHTVNGLGPRATSPTLRGTRVIVRR